MLAWPFSEEVISRSYFNRNSDSFPKLLGRGKFIQSQGLVDAGGVLVLHFMNSI